jgi:hypothetical protein
MTVIARRAGAALSLALLLSAGSLAACSSGSAGSAEVPPTASPTAGSAAAPTSYPTGTSPDLEDYTDTGDGCEQAISAISYADDVLVRLGQEPYQTFDDAVRSRLAAVAGTLSLEAKDWPDKAIYRQAQIVQPLAQAAGARLPDDSAEAKAARVNVLLRYRIAAGTLILVCRDAAAAEKP